MQHSSWICRILCDTNSFITTCKYVIKFYSITTKSILVDTAVQSPKSMHTPLHIACLKRNWMAIEELLKYKANLNGIKNNHILKLTTYIVKDKLGKTCIEYLAKEDRQKINELIVKYTPSTKPERACPCFSGKLLTECHATTQPYPLHFLCVCSSGIFFVELIYI